MTIVLYNGLLTFILKLSLKVSLKQLSCYGKKERELAIS